MTYRRLLTLYLTCLIVFFILLVRVFFIANNTQYASYAKGQTVTTLSLPTTRGNFYDCDGVALTGQMDTWYALCVPGEESYANLYNDVNESTQSTLYQKRNSTIPFLIPVEQDLSTHGIYTICTTERYPTVPFAPHLIGYLDQEQVGITGLEAAFESVLAGTSEQSYLQCVTNAQGKLMDETEPVLHQSISTASDIQLTLSKQIQRTAEGVASVMMEQGAIVVLETDTAKVRASVSAPSYNPNAVAESLHSEQSALLNRVFHAYSVGSVFKPVLAAAAIEQSIDWYTTECKGYVDINGQIYRCANGVAHGTVNLDTALEQSCNCYFIELGQILGGETIVNYAKSFGFGNSVSIFDTASTASGYFPTAERLENLGQLANISFGQGELLATPLQIAGMMNTIVNDGFYVTPSYIEGSGETDKMGEFQLTESLYQPERHRVISADAANYLQKILVGVVDDGIGWAAKPDNNTAGGKTGTAQTGRYDENGMEYQDLWFAGFYPAEQPQYTIVVMQDEQTKATYSSAQIFAKLCEELTLLDLSETQSILPVS